MRCHDCRAHLLGAVLGLEASSLNGDDILLAGQVIRYKQVLFCTQYKKSHRVPASFQTRQNLLGCVAGVLGTIPQLLLQLDDPAN
jgi:hypothetical protein